MMNFIIQEWQSLLIVIFFIVFCLWLIKIGHIQKVRQMLFYLVCEAEEQYGSGTGELKYSSVVSKIYPMLPTIVKLLISTKELDTLIEEAVTYMKQYLDSNEQAKRRILWSRMEYLSQKK